MSNLYGLHPWDWDRLTFLQQLDYIAAYKDWAEHQRTANKG